jgi:hypothetical protein
LAGQPARSAQPPRPRAPPTTRQVGASCCWSLRTWRAVRCGPGLGGPLGRAGRPALEPRTGRTVATTSRPAADWTVATTPLWCRLATAPTHRFDFIAPRAPGQVGSSGPAPSRTPMSLAAVSAKRKWTPSHGSIIGANAGGVGRQTSQATSGEPSSGAGVNTGAPSRSARLRASRSCHGQVSTTTASLPTASSSISLGTASGSKRSRRLSFLIAYDETTPRAVSFGVSDIDARRCRSASFSGPVHSGCGASQCQMPVPTSRTGGCYVSGLGRRRAEARNVRDVPGLRNVRKRLAAPNPAQ